MFFKEFRSFSRGFPTIRTTLFNKLSTTFSHSSGDTQGKLLVKPVHGQGETLSHLFVNLFFINELIV
jgi:hypothetical protein